MASAIFDKMVIIPAKEYAELLRRAQQNNTRQVTSSNSDSEKAFDTVNRKTHFHGQHIVPLPQMRTHNEKNEETDTEDNDDDDESIAENSPAWLNMWEALI